MSDPGGEDYEGFPGEGRKGGRPFGGLAVDEGGTGGVEEHDEDGPQVLDDEDGAVPDLREGGRGCRGTGGGEGNSQRSFFPQLYIYSSLRGRIEKHISHTTLKKGERRPTWGPRSLKTKTIPSLYPASARLWVDLSSLMGGAVEEGSAGRRKD